MAKAGQGGGYLGGFFERILVVTLGDGGAAVVMFAWLLLGLAFTFDLSIPDLFRKLTNPAVKTGEFITEKTARIVETSQEHKAASKAKQMPVFVNGSGHPQGFTPIENKPLKKLSLKKDGTQAVVGSVAEPAPSGAQMARIFQSSASSLDWRLPKIDEILNRPPRQSCARTSTRSAPG